MDYIVFFIMFAAGFVILFLILRGIIRRWFVKEAQLESIKREVEKMLVDLNHTASRNVDLIEARVGQLKDMLSAVDKRIGLLRRESEKHEMSKTVYNRIVQAPAPRPEIAEKPNGKEGETVLPVRERILNLYHSGFSTSMIANQLGKSVGEVELVISLAERE